MNVSVEDIRSIPAGALRLFPVDDGKKIRSARSLVSIVKNEMGMPEGVVDYELRKYNLEIGLVVGIRALREGDSKFLKL
jgi:hypothetical protein